MLKTKITLFAFIVTGLAITAMMPEKSSSGAPASHTGAPGEQTCATVGCHDDNSVNAGNASLTVDMGTATSYAPNQIYTITIKIKDNYVNRFGFQLVALSDSNTSNVGTFQLTDPFRTQLTRNRYELTDRKYVTYTFDGTDAVYNGKGEWEVNWVAPASNVGPITFYAAAVSANDDEMDSGDYVYTVNKTINPK